MKKRFMYLMAGCILALSLIAGSCSLNNAFYGVGEDVDTQDPEIKATSPTSGSYVPPTFTLQGTYSDNVGVSKVRVLLKGTDKSWDASVGGGVWSKSFTAADGLGIGDRTFEVYAYDKEGNKSFTQIYTIIDNNVPVITVISPSLKGSAADFDSLNPNSYADNKFFSNQTISVKGEIDDDGPIESVTLTLTDAVTLVDRYSQTFTREQALPAGVSGNTKNWTFNIDSVAQLDDDTKYLVRVRAVDAAGNTTDTTTTLGYLYVLQSSDIPKALTSTPENGKITFPQSVASGTAFDDDGLKAVYWYVNMTTRPEPPDDYTLWGTTTSTDYASGVINLTANPGLTSWDFITPSDKGEYKIYIWPVDMYDSAPASLADLNVVTFTQTTSDTPIINITGPDPTVTQGGSVTVNLNANGAGKNVQTISYRLESDLPVDSGWQVLTAGTDFVAGQNVVTSFNFDSTLYVNSSNAAVSDIKVSVKCANTSNIESYTTITYLRADNTAPTVSLSSPVTKANKTDFDSLSLNNYNDLQFFQNGIFLIKGDISDNGPVQSVTLNLKDADTLAVEYTSTITSGTALPPGASGTTKSWTFTVNSVASLTDNKKYLVNVTAIDSAGNAVDSGTSLGYIYVVQESDIPKVNIATPENGSSTFPQSVASGTAFDDDGLSKIYWLVQKTTLPAPANDYTLWPTGETADYNGGVMTLSGNPTLYSWNFTTPTGTGEYRVYLWPVDMNGGEPANLADLSTKTFIQTVSDTPVLQITGPSPEITQSGQVTVNVTANGAGKNVKSITYRVESALPADSGTITLNAGTDFSADPLVSTSFNFNSTTFVNNSNSSIHDIKVTVYCTNIDNINSQTVTTYLRADNTAPTLTIASPGATSIINGIQQVKGTTNDWSTTKALYIGYFTSVNMASYTTEAQFEANMVSEPAAPVLNKWYKISSPSTSWSHNFNTSIITASILNPYNFYVAAVDKVGNVSYVTNQYVINQDLDRPTATVTQPSYSGSITAPWTDVDKMEKFATSFLITGTAYDDDGVDRVTVDVYLMDYTGVDHSVTSTVVSSSTVVGTNNWSYTLENLAICSSTQYYMIVPYVRDINLREEQGAPSYFIVSDVVPSIEILWPSTLDPDGDKRWNSIDSIKEVVNDAFGTVISNVKDDNYWDNNPNNNHLYLSDSPKYFFGWENAVFNDDTNNDGLPDNPAIAYSDFSESVLNIFDSEVGADSGRSGYFRMIFKAKDGNADGNLTKVEVSYNGGSSWETAFVGNPLVNQNTTKYAMESSHGDGFTWFYINLNTATLGASEIIKIRVTDDNLPIPYFSIASLQVTSDNSKPSGSFVSWGTSDPDNKTNLSSTSGYLGGNADDGQTGIRYAKLYIWDNQNTSDSPYFGDVSGNYIANVSSGTYNVNIPDLNQIDTGDNDPEADYMVKASMYTPQNWRIPNIYSEINPVDGIKLVCLEVTDNAGNKEHIFKELIFSEYPPSFDSTYLWWDSMAEVDKIATSGQTTAQRIWVSGVLKMSGVINDNKAGDPDPGMTNVTINIKKDDGTTTYVQWSTVNDGDIEITGGTGTGQGPFNWTLTGENTALVNAGQDGSYLMEIIIKDKVGVTTVQKQYIYIDNTAPTLTIDDPVEGIKVTGDFNINGMASDTGGFDSGSLKIEIMLAGNPTGTEWTITPATNGTWSQWWDTSLPVNFDKVRVTFTDKALNETVAEKNISPDPNAPHYTAFSVVDTDGPATLLNYGAFTSLYSELGSSEVYLVRGNLSFGSTIEDNEPITDSGVYLTGVTQQTVAAVNEPYKVLNPASDVTAPANYSVGQTGSYIYNSLADGEYTYRAWIEQQSGAIEVNLRKNFIVDNQTPHVWIEDMQAGQYGKSDPDKKWGHIELNSTYDGADDDVSGVVYLDLKVFDNYLIDTVEVRLTDVDFGNGVGNYTTIFNRNNSDGSLLPLSGGELGDLNYWETTVNDELLKENKNWLSLTFEFNTANVVNVAGLNKQIEFRVTDMAGNVVGTTNSAETVVDPIAEADVLNTGINFITPVSGYQNVAAKTVDIVPYITDIQRMMDTERTKYGKFIVQEGENNITVTGYNLAQTGTNWMRVYNTAGTASDVVTVSSAAAPYTSMTIALTNVTHSGYLRVAVNGVEAINNINDNNAATNQEDDGTHPEWNDDRYLHVWKVGDSFANSSNPEHPSMAMATNGTLYGVWSNYGASATYYATTVSRVEIFKTYDPPEWTDVAIASDNERRIVYLQNYYNGTTTWGYLMTYESAGQEAYIEKLGDDSNTTPNHADGEDETLYQFQNPRIAIYDNLNYISYYDAFSKTLKYAVSSGGTETFTSFAGHKTDGATVVDGIDDFDNTPTDGDDVGLWSDIVIDKVGGTDANVNNFRPVIIYYDTTNQTLKLARGNGNQPFGSAQWTKQAVFKSDDPNRFYSGHYVSMKIDSAGNLHAVFYKNSTGDLLYIRADNIDGTGTYNFGYSEIIDSAGAVGSWCDLTLVGTTPYVSYLNSSMIGTFYGIKYAYKKGGNWEYGIAPSTNSVYDGRTSIEASTTATWGEAAVSFKSSVLPVIYLKPEE